MTARGFGERPVDVIARRWGRGDPASGLVMQVVTAVMFAADSSGGIASCADSSRAADAPRIHHDGHPSYRPAHSSPQPSADDPRAACRFQLHDSPGSDHQILQHSLLVRRSDDSRALVTCAQNALHLGTPPSRWRPPPDPPPLRTSVYSASVVATPHPLRTPPPPSVRFWACPKLKLNFVSSSARPRGAGLAALLLDGTAQPGFTLSRMRLVPAPAPSRV